MGWDEARSSGLGASQLIGGRNHDADDGDRLTGRQLTPTGPSATRPPPIEPATYWFAHTADHPKIFFGVNFTERVTADDWELDMGRPQAYEGSCPYCLHPFGAVLFSSHYIDSVRLWSDGYQEFDGWNSSGEDDWRLCPTCNRLMDLRNAKLTMQHEPMPPPLLPKKSVISKLCSIFRKSPSVADESALDWSHEAPTPDAPGTEPIHPSSIQQELDSFTLPVDLERRLRKIAWLRWSHSQLSNKPTRAWHLANMEHLLPLMKEGNEDCILISAELLRQLGRFDEAAARLQQGRHDISEKNRYVAELMAQACRDRLTEPFVLKKRFSETK